MSSWATLPIENAYTIVPNNTSRVVQTHSQAYGGAVA